jgi:hypothetical protein
MYAGMHSGLKKKATGFSHLEEITSSRKGKLLTVVTTAILTAAYWAKIDV